VAILGCAISMPKANYINIEDNKEYRIAGVKSYGKGVVIRRTVMGSSLTMKKYQVIKENQLMWCKVDTKNGAFGITHKEHVGALASTNMALGTINGEIYVPEFIEALFQLKPFYDWITKYSSGSTNRKYLTPKDLLAKVEIPNLAINEQIAFQRKVDFLKQSGFDAELTHQQTLLKNLRKQILQEAIEGKISADWRAQNPNVEPASNLLKRISAEKAQLVKDKKIQAKKALPPITDEEKQFKLPKGWGWCRLGSLFEVVRGSSPRPKGDPRYWTFDRTRFHWITIADFTPFGVNGVLSDTKSFLTEEGSKKSRYIKKGDLLIACSGVGSVGRSIQSGIDGYIYDGLLAIRNILNLTIRDYLQLFLLFKEAQIYDVASGANWLNINIEILSNYVVAIPPEEEIRLIVSKLESINTLCNSLETRITQNQIHAEQMMQAVLKEAFRHNSEATHALVIKTKSANHA
jgi:type I restriction enzyme S subunit